MATAVIVFDDRPGLAIDFAEILERRLKDLGISAETSEDYICYRTEDPAAPPIPPAEIARQAATWAEGEKKKISTLDRFVFVVDLSPFADGSHLDYGLSVVQALPKPKNAPYKMEGKRFFCL